MERCWNQDPRHRPDISEVLLCLHTTPALRSDRSNANHCQAPEDTTTLESIRERDFSISKLSFIVPSRDVLTATVIERVVFSTLPLGTHLPRTSAISKTRPHALVYFRCGARRGRLLGAV